MQYKSWLSSPAGKRFIELERSKLSDITPTVFGYYALLLGEPEFVVCLQDSQIKHKALLHAEASNISNQMSLVRSRQDKLAIDSNSLDLIYLAHCLEFSNNQHEILREAYRALRPDGRLILTMFNPLSLGGLWYQSIWKADFITMIKLKDWLALLGFDIIRVNYYRMAYLVEASKRIIPVTPIMPAWAAREKVVTSDLSEPTT